jgi:acyl-CoA synthetase (AMP-forming)/AMP-acid ligase II
MNRWSDEERARYYASGIWDRRGLYALLAQHPPDKLAFHDGVESITYGDLRARAGELATTIEPRSVVAVQMGNTIEHVVAAYAVAAANAILFELPPDSTPTQVAAAMHRTRAVELEGNVKGTVPFRLAGEDTEAVSLLIGTSGTTGTPKIAMRSTNGSCAMARHVLSCTGIGRDDVVMIAAPLSGGVGYINGLCSTAITGSTTIIPRELKIEVLMELIERHRVTAICTLPTLVVRMLATAGDAPALRVVQTGGAYLHPQVAAALEDRFECRVVSAYGAIDVGIPSMVKADGDTAQHRHETVGRPFPEVELRLIDGEVAMRGPSTALGYFEDEEATRAVYDDEGWGHFGDLGRIDEDGYLRIVGRLKEVINRGGKKISVNEVENHVRAFPGVRDVAAVGYDDPELGERCCAVVVSDEVVTLDALREFLTARGVPKFMWPERVHRLEELPMSAQGKVRRRELKELISSA